MSAATSTTPSTGMRGRPIPTLIAVCFGLFMVGLDGTVVAIANPAISTSLHTSFIELQWITASYLLALGAFLIFAGKLGDRYGRRTMYLAGIVAFGLSSLGIGLIENTAGVIVLRGVQGLAAALMMPQTLALLRVTWPRERFGLAAGIWGGASSVAIAAGPIVGGLLVQTLGWEWVFFINVPIALIGLVFGCFALPQSKAADAGRIDVPGTVLLILGLLGVVFAVVQSQAWGWASPLTLGSLLLGILLLVAFGLVERRVGNPLVPLDLLRLRGVSLGALAVATNFFVLFGMTFLLTLFLLNTRGATEIGAGVMQLPLSGLSIIAPPVGAAVVSRIGARATATIGLVLDAVAVLGLLTMTADSPYLLMAIPFVLMAFGVGFTITSASEAIVGSAPLRLAGVAGGLQTTAIQVGGAMGTAVLSAITAAGAAAGAARLHLGTAAVQGLAQGVVPSGLGTAGAKTAQDAFLAGLHHAFLAAGIVALLVAAAVALFLRVTNAHHSPEQILEETVEGEAGHD